MLGRPKLTAFEIGIEDIVSGAEHVAHDTKVGRVVNAVAKVTLDPLLERFVDVFCKTNQGEGHDKYDR